MSGATTATGTTASDRTVLVTGASSGLGRAIAIGFARTGAHVAVGFRRDEAGAAATADAIAAAGGAATLLGFDVTDPAAVTAAVDRLVAARGGVDVAVHAAGVARDALFALAAPADWQEPIAVNLGGALALARAVVRPMMARRAGAIVLVGSVAGLRASPGQAGYAASKGGVLGLTATLGAELAPRGVRVNAVVPGFIAAGMVKRLDRRVVDRAVERIPLGRLGEADEVAEVAVFLASDAARYVVGQAIVVDGGLSL